MTANLQPINIPAFGENKPKTLMIDPKILEEMKGKSILIIIEDCIAHEIRISNRGGKLHLEVKQIGQDDLNRIVKDKIAVYQAMKNIVFGAGIVGTAAAEVLLGGNAVVKGTLTVFGKGLEQAEKIYDKSDQAGLNRLQHAEGQVTQHNQDKSKHKDGTDQNFHQAVNTKDKIDSMRHDLFRTLYSAS